MLDLATARVPFEFVGLARLFRTEVKAADVAMEAALDVICTPLLARLKRKPTLRPETLPVIACQYERMIPRAFRIGKTEGARHKTDFAVTETRLCVSWLHDDHWVDPEVREPGITLCKFVFSVQAGRLRRRWTPLAAVGLHALARRVERGQDRSHAALVRDLAVLADADAADERVATAGGFWLGGVINANGDDGRKLRIRSVRTWLPS